MQHRFSHGLAGNGARVDAHAPDGGLLFDDRHSFPCFCALNGGSLSAGTGANHQSDHTAAFDVSCPVESASGSDGSAATSFEV